MSEHTIFQIDPILLSFPTLDQVKIAEVMSYDPTHELFNELVAIFDSELADKLNQINEQYAMRHFTEVSQLAHRIRSTSLNLGATRLSEILKRIEYTALESQVLDSDIKLLIQSLEKEFRAASDRLHVLMPSESK